MTVGAARGVVVPLGLVAVLLVSACSDANAPADGAAPVASTGQVATVVRPQVSFYAASRFAEQATFGPTPALVADIQARGLEGWIDAQFALPASQHDLAPMLATVPTGQAERDAFWRADHQRHQGLVAELALTAPDQLRGRVAWTLSQMLALGDRFGDRLGMVVYQNLLLRNAFGRYEDLLYDVARNAHVGELTGQRQNRIAGEDCPHCRPNTHFARALLHHYTVGPVLLETDATPRRVDGRLVPAYTARDVAELARALTGWQFDTQYDVVPRHERDWGNWRKPLVAQTWPGIRDYGAKRILGQDFAAYQSHEEDLRGVLALLTGHDNAAPFVAIRLIRHLVKSDPSAAYVQRVAAVFRNNGAGVRGDLKALVKAVLLDAEARAGDDPARASAQDGRFRDSFLHYTTVLRAMGCPRILRNTDGWQWGLPGQQFPDTAPTVAGWTRATDRAPLSGLPNPEQRLLHELPWRGILAGAWGEFNATLGYDEPGRWRRAGCAIDTLSTTMSANPAAYLDWIGQRFFRGAMPPRTRAVLEQVVRDREWNLFLPTEAPMRVLMTALLSPDFGVVR